MNLTAILAGVILLLLAAAGGATYKWSQERTLRAQAIDGYNQVVQHWQDNQAALSTLHRDLADSRKARADLERTVTDHDLETLSRTDSPALLSFVNGTAARLFDEFAAATGAAPDRAAVAGSGQPAAARVPAAGGQPGGRVPVGAPGG